MLYRFKIYTMLFNATIVRYLGQVLLVGCSLVSIRPHSTASSITTKLRWVCQIFQLLSHKQWRGAKFGHTPGGQFCHAPSLRNNSDLFLHNWICVLFLILNLVEIWWHYVMFSLLC